jgi:hypothetical protein
MPGPPHSRGFYVTHNDAPQSVGLHSLSSQRLLPNNNNNNKNTHNRQTFIPPVGFEPTISAGEWPQTYALDGAATGTGTTAVK